MSVDFKYYMFDWDDNILHMPTRIVLEKKEGGKWVSRSVSTSEFATIRRDTENYRPPNDDWDQAFVEFYDTGERGDQAFIEDTMLALDPVVKGNASGAPSFDRFKKALLEGRLFAIITARAHSASSIRKGVEYFIEQVLTDAERAQMIEELKKYIVHFGGDPSSMTDEAIMDQYLDTNRYRGVTSPEFQDLMGLSLAGSESPEEAKQMAIRDFVHHVIGIISDRGIEAPISMGFSDDDPHNVLAIEDFLEKELAREFPDIKFVVYDTSDPDHPEGRKIVIRGK